MELIYEAKRDHINMTTRSKKGKKQDWTLRTEDSVCCRWHVTCPWRTEASAKQNTSIWSYTSNHNNRNKHCCVISPLWKLKYLPVKLSESCLCSFTDICQSGKCKFWFLFQFISFFLGLADSGSALFFPS